MYNKNKHNLIVTNLDDKTNLIAQDIVENKFKKINHNCLSDKDTIDTLQTEFLLNLDNFENLNKGNNENIVKKSLESKLVSTIFIKNTDMVENKAQIFGKGLKRFFQDKQIGDFDFYHRAGRYTYRCDHSFGQEGSDVIEKFLLVILQKELHRKKIHLISDKSHVSVVFR